jgi:hypothetical protein
MAMPPLSRIHSVTCIAFSGDVMYGFKFIHSPCTASKMRASEQDDGCDDASDPPKVYPDKNYHGDDCRPD